jgi:hypothetical protein
MANFKGLLAKGPPETPIFVLFLRIAALVLTLAVFVAACYNASLLDQIVLLTQDEAGPAGLGIFTCIWTWGVVGTEIAFTMKLPHLYMRIVFVILDVLTLIFWLSTWAVAASVASDALEDRASTIAKKYGGSAAAIAGLGAIVWVILIVIFVFWVMAAIRGSPEPTTTAELGNMKAEGAPAAAPAVQQQQPPQQYPPQHPPQQYPPQQYPPQQGTPQPYPPQQGTPQPYGQQPYPQQGTPQPYPQQPYSPTGAQSPYSSPGSPAPGQPQYPPQQATPYPPGELQGYPQEPQHPQQPQAPYPQ